MKKLLLPLSIAACFSVQAQSTSTVELYGVADAGLNFVTGTTNTTQRLASGIMDGSRWGLRGNEDFGGGWRALFTLENRFELDDGNLGNRPASGLQAPDRLARADLLGLPGALQTAVNGVATTLASRIGVNTNNSLFDRQAFAALVTPVGAILAGRQYTPAYEVFATFDATKTQSSLSAGQVSAVPAGVEIRMSDSVAYRIQLGGFSAAAMMTFETVTPKDANRLIGVNAIYRGTGYSVGFGYNERNNELGDKALKSTVLGATADIGPGTASVMLGQIVDDNPAGLSGISALLQAGGATASQGNLVQSAYINALRQDARLYNVGYSLKTGDLTSTVAYSLFNDRRSANADVTSYGVTWTYALTKRTDINLVLAHFNNENLAQAAPGGAGFLGGFTKSAGTDSNNIALGLRHRF